MSFPPLARLDNPLFFVSSKPPLESSAPVLAAERRASSEARLPGAAVGFPQGTGAAPDPEPEEGRGSRGRARARALWLGPLLGLAVGAGVFAAGLGRDAAVTAGLTCLCALWWTTEPIHLAATGIVPLAALPLLGVVGHKEVAASYGHPLILLLLGGLLVSSALERSGAHRRLALMMVGLMGRRSGATSNRRLVLGFLLTSALLSMWISNTATALMLVPVAMALVEWEPAERKKALAVPLLLGIAYGASIGGLGTPIGTPPNVLFLAMYEEATQKSVSFLDWMKLGIPVTLALVPVAWWVVCRGLSGAPVASLPKPGPWRPAERRVLAVFLVTALAWMTRVEPYGGWTGLLGLTTVGDSTIALAAFVALAVSPDGEGGRLLPWSTASRVPWGLLLLFSGGLALARAFSASGLSAAMGEALASVAVLPLPLLLIAVALGVSFLTEVTSNTATAAVLLPVLAATAERAGLEPEWLMVPAVLSASCAFMLPVATAPNAIVFGAGQIEARQMAAVGYRLNLLASLVISALCYLSLPL